MSEKKKIVLSMIVKNETHIIKECFDSLYKFIDYWVICDTGSTDGTQELIKQYFAEKGIPGELHQHEWQDFATNRTAALKLCDGKGDYAWMIDADDYLVGQMNFPHNLNFDGYSVRIKRGNFEWWRNQIFKTGIGWCYEGVLHEYAHCPNKADLSLAKLDMPGYHVEARTEGGARNKGITPTEKYSKDAIVLEKALEKEPLNSRYQFYLAQSYFDSQQWEKSFDAYEKRAKMGGWEEEVYYSLFRMAIIAMMQQKPWEQVINLFLGAYNYRPCRSEPLFHISRIYRLNGYPRIAHIYAKMGLTIPLPKWDILFISQDNYEWQLLDELASTAYYVHNFEEGLQACKTLLSDGKIPSSEIQRLQTNLAEYEKKVAEMRQNELQLHEHQKKMNNAVAVAPNITEGNGSTIKPKLPIPNQTTLSIADAEPKYKKKKFKERTKG
jgi:glycosyltransferase involved in cell wall biosynthesis